MTRRSREDIARDLVEAAESEYRGPFLDRVIAEAAAALREGSALDRLAARCNDVQVRRVGNDAFAIARRTYGSEYVPGVGDTKEEAAAACLAQLEDA